MSYRDLNDEEKTRFELMIKDLTKIFSYDEIPAEDIPDLLSELESEEVIDYIDSLSKGSKPESALREAFFAGRSLISRFFGGSSTPEVNLGSGFIDYILRVDGRYVLIELKSLFEPVYESGKTRRVKSLKKREMKFERHKEQVLKYLREGSEYIILTDLKDWYFFNRKVNPITFTYFSHFDIHKLIEEYQVMGDFWDFLRRQDEQTIKEDLDKEFFESLKIWVTKLSEVEFETDEQTKIEHIIRLLNKFMFIQTLDDFYVIDARWIKTNWDDMERKWKAKGQLKVLEEYFKEINEWFYEYYDTELFRENVLDHIKKDEQNIEKLYNSLQLVLGVTGWQTTFRGIAGIMQHNFRFIDEDIFGKAYETFLAEVRHDEGIYYTPKYITRYIVDSTVGKTFDKILSDIEQALEKDDFESANNNIKRFKSIRVLDPACGSGSFLIKAVRVIMERYRYLKGLLDTMLSESNKYTGSLVRSKAVEEKTQQIQSLILELHSRNERDLISRLLVRHIHGNDLDRKALEVAKVNIWLEAIKLAPQEFRFDKLPRDTNHILPDLEMNLINGDTVFSLPDNIIIDSIQKNFRAELERLTDLRKEYLENPTKPELVIQIKEIKNGIRKNLVEEFSKYLKKEGFSEKILDETIPLFWPLDMWYFYFLDSKPRAETDTGADIIVGNPPYQRIQTLNRKAPEYVEYLNNSGYKTATKNYDLAVIFIERGLQLLRTDGEFGYIVTNKFMQVDYGEATRKLLSQSNFVTQLVDFGHEQVFEDASIYTCLLFLKKSKNPLIKYVFVKTLERTLEQLTIIKDIQNDENPTLIIRTVPSTKLGSNVWSIPRQEEDTIKKKLDNFPNLKPHLKNVSQGITTSGDKVFLLEMRECQENFVIVYSKSKNSDYSLERALLKPILKGSEVTKWICPNYKYLVLLPYKIVNNKSVLIPPQEFKSKYPKTWKYVEDNKKELENRERGRMIGQPNWYGYIYKKNLEKFEQPKILTQVLAYRPTFALDLEGKLYHVGGGTAGVYGITVKQDSWLSLKILCGLLNSTVLEWYHRQSASRFRGGYHAYTRGSIESLPAPVKNDATKIIVKEMNDMVDEVATFKQASMMWEKLWKEECGKLKTVDYTLEYVLNNDGEKVRAGDFEDTWMEDVSFYLNKSDKKDLEKEYLDFRLVISSKEKEITIYGISDSIEKEIYNIRFKNEELFNHIYACLISLFNSRKKVRSLFDIFKKTTVPVIRPNPKENTVNIIKKVKERFDKWSKELQRHNITNNLTTLHIKIRDLEAKIDYKSYKLFDLNNNEMEVIMQSLNLSPLYQQLVLINE